jgi:hypothetical protein
VPWRWLGQTFEHYGYHGEFGEALGDDSDGFVMGHEAAVASYPGEGTLDDPAPADELEPAFLVRALDDLQGDPLSGQIGSELVSAVAAICKDVADEREQPAGLFDKLSGAVPILNAGGDRLDAKQQSYRIDNRVALDAFDFLACVVANGIPASAPFSVAFTACVSMMAAVGEASRPSASRQAMSSA